MIRAQEQVQQFDELMKRTKEKHKTIQQLCKQQTNTNTAGNMQSTITRRTDELASTSDGPIKTTILNVEINEATDEYGRNIVRIQIPHSMLYENVIEIKKIAAKDDDNDNNSDNDDEDDHDDDYERHE